MIYILNMQATIHAQQFDNGGLIQHISIVTQKGLKLLHNALDFQKLRSSLLSRPPCPLC